MSTSEAPTPPVFKAISDTGLVNLMEHEAKAIESVPIFYEAGGTWYGPDQDGFSMLKDSQAATFVTYYGFSKSDKFSNDHGQKPVDRALLWLKQRRKVAYAGPLAGYPAGLHQCGPDRILVTEPTKLVEPKKGDFSKIKLLIESMLMDEGKKPLIQIHAFYTLAAARYNTLFDRLQNPEAATFRFCPALALVGPKSCGKSALIDLVLKPLFGGRVGDPTSWLNEPKFNKDLFIAPLLVMDDKGSPPTLAIRRQRGENLKDLIWKEEQRMEGKGRDAISLRPFRWLIMACNVEDSALQILPTLTDSLADKIIHILCRQAEGLPATHEENAQWVKDLRAELPAFAYFLRQFKPPKNAELNPRSRVIIYHHPGITEKLRSMQPEMKLLGLIDHYRLWKTETMIWEGSATEFNEAMLEADEKHNVFRSMFSSLNALGRALKELVNVAPERVEVKDHNGTSHYRIRPATTQS